MEKENKFLINSKEKKQDRDNESQTERNADLE